MELNFLLKVSIGLLAILSITLGLASVFLNRRSRAAQLWCLLSASIGVWSSGLLLVMFAKTEQQGIFYSQLLHLGAAFIPVLFLHFVLRFTYDVSAAKRIFLRIGYVAAVIFGLLSFTTNIVAGSPPQIGFDRWVSVGPWYPAYLIYFWVYSFATMYFLFQGYRRSDGVMRRKIGYVFVASIIGFIGGGTSFLPQTLGIYPYGDFVVWLYPILVTWGIFVDEIHIRIRS